VYRNRLSQRKRDYAGTYVNRIRSSAIRSLASRCSGGRGPAKNGLPPPNSSIKTGLGQALRQDCSANLNLARQFSLQPADHLLEVIRDKRSVRILAGIDGLFVGGAGFELGGFADRF
jgi:hypothetical protein